MHTNDTLTGRHLCACVKIETHFRNRHTARGSFTTPFFEPNMLNKTNKHVCLLQVRTPVDSRSFEIWSASGLFDCDNTPQVWMTACSSVFQHRFTVIIFFTIRSTYTINISLADAGPDKIQASKEVLPKENFVGYVSLRRYRRVGR